MLETSSVLPSPPSPGRTGRPGCGSYALLVAVGAWILIVTVLAQVSTWVIDNLRMDSTAGLSGWTWTAVTWGQLLLLAIPLVPLALARPIPSQLRAIFQTWAVAAGCAALLALGRLFRVQDTQPGAAVQALAGFVGALVLWLAARRRRPVTAGVTWIPAALALGGLVAIPSLAWGALGSPVDAALQLVAAAAFGLVAGLLLSGWLFGPILREAHEQGAVLGRAGRALAVFGTGAALFILGSAFSFRGGQLLLLIALPPLGIALAALALAPLSAARRSAPAFPAAGQWQAAWLPPAVVVGVVTASLTLLWDPDELSLLLGEGDILGWGLRAAEVSLAVATTAGLVLWSIHGRLARGARSTDGSQEPALAPAPRPGRVWVIAALVAWLAAGAAYVALGHPGFYGEQFFVILRDQADVQPAYQIADRNRRLTFVYTTLTAQANRTQARLRQILDGRGIPYQPYYLVNSLQVNGGPLLRRYLAGQPEVARIIDSPHLRPLPELPPVATGDVGKPGTPPWNITLLGADRVWRELGVTGQGIVVGQSDSGVQGDHPALAEGYRGRNGQNDYNWLDPWYGTREPRDIGGHGTHTLGSVLGRDGIGVAPGAEWIACVNLARNLGNPPLYLNCLQFMLAPYPQGGDAFRDGDPTRAAHVLNNSWGCPPVEGCDATALEPAAAALRAAGIFVVASAGNGGPACSSVADPLALYGNVLSVGAIDSNSDLASFSSRGPVTVDGSGRTKPDIVAPGVEVVSAFPRSTYASESGTSMAGPHLAGVVALMWSAQPRLIGDVDRTTQILIQTARPYTRTMDRCAGSAGLPNNDAGFGIVDAYAAVKAAQALNAP